MRVGALMAYCIIERFVLVKQSYLVESEGASSRIQETKQNQNISIITI